MALREAGLEEGEDDSLDPNSSFVCAGGKSEIPAADNGQFRVRARKWTKMETKMNE